MKKCIKCGNEWDDDMRFCPLCGSNMEGILSQPESEMKALIVNRTPYVPPKMRKKTPLWAKIIKGVGVTIAVLIVIVAGVFVYKRMNTNKNKGAADPKVIADTYQRCLKTEDFSDLEKYIDDYGTGQYQRESFRVDCTNYNDLMRQLNGIDFRTEYTCSEIYGYDEVGMDMMTVYTQYYVYDRNRKKDIALLSDGGFNLHIHMSKTPDGYRWFLGGFSKETIMY